MLGIPSPRPEILRHIARRFMRLGGMVTAFMIVVAVAHYGFGMAFHDADAGKDVAPAESLGFWLLSGGGLLFFGVGFALTRFLRDR